MPFQRVGASGTTKGQDRSVSDFNFGQRWNTNFVQKSTVRAAQIVQVDGICVTRDNTSNKQRGTKDNKRNQKNRKRETERLNDCIRSLPSFPLALISFLSSFLPFFLSSFPPFTTYRSGHAPMHCARVKWTNDSTVCHSPIGCFFQNDNIFVGRCV